MSEMGRQVQQESLLFLPDEEDSDIFLRVRWFVPW